MNLLFLSLGEFGSLKPSSVHIDLVKELRNYFDVYLVCKSEPTDARREEVSLEEGIHILRVKVGNIKRNNNMIQKGISTVMLETQYRDAVKKHFQGVRFDHIMYTTPPITLVKTIEYIRQRDNARTCLLLKDIFPQNAVDLGILSEKGIKGLIYKYFRNKEKELYALSDHIGCMSPANKKFLLENNPEVLESNVGIFPNCIYIRDKSIDESDSAAVREKYGIPSDSLLFVYGGNLGKPQGIDFLIECLAACKDKENVFFLIIGDGSEYEKLSGAIQPVDNARLISKLPQEEYDTIVAASDVGMLFLDHKFTIPNFPSRLLSYLQAKKPVLAVTDPNTDVGTIAADNGFGWMIESNDTQAFVRALEEVKSADLKEMGQRGYSYMEQNYDVEKCTKGLVGLLKG